MIEITIKRPGVIDEHRQKGMIDGHRVKTEIEMQAFVAKHAEEWKQRKRLGCKSKIEILKAGLLRGSLRVDCY